MKTLPKVLGNKVILGHSQITKEGERSSRTHTLQKRMEFLAYKCNIFRITLSKLVASNHKNKSSQIIHYLILTIKKLLSNLNSWKHADRKVKCLVILLLSKVFIISWFLTACLIHSCQLFSPFCHSISCLHLPAMMMKVRWNNSYN